MPIYTVHSASLFGSWLREKLISCPEVSQIVAVELATVLCSLE